MLDYLKAAALYVGAMVLYIGSNIVAVAIHAVFNALGAWIILEQFDYSLSFWQYILVGAGLAIILNGNQASND